MQEWQSTKQGVPLDEFKAQLYRLTSHEYAKKSWQTQFQETALGNETNQINRFIKNYLEKTYNIVRQQRYERDLDKQTHAKSWETKKNIDKDTQQIMDRSSLHQYFSKIELDNDAVSYTHLTLPTNCT